MNITPTAAPLAHATHSELLRTLAAKKAIPKGAAHQAFTVGKETHNSRAAMIIRAIVCPKRGHHMPGWHAGA